MQMDEEEKDKFTCDEVFCLYLRNVCKLVNENYYKNVLRFVLLYRECLNEYGWLKRRETYMEAGMLDEDTLLATLKTQEEQNEKTEENKNSERNQEKELEEKSPNKVDSEKNEE